MFNSKKDLINRFKILESEIEKLSSELSSKRREEQNHRMEVTRASRMRDFRLEQSEKELVISIQGEIDKLVAQVEKLRSQHDELQLKLNSEVRNSLRSSSVFKKYDELQRSCDALEAKERELAAQLRRAEKERDGFIEVGAEGNYGPGGWERYKKRCAELSMIASKLNDQFVAVRAEKERLMESKLQEARSALYHRESELFEELMQSN